MKFCPHCGEAVRDDANYCTHCGSTIYHDYNDTHMYDLRDEDFESNEERAERLKQTKNNDESKALGIILVIFAWIGVAMTLMGVVFENTLIFIVDEAFYLGGMGILFQLFPLFWKIPMAIYATNNVRKHKRFTSGFAIISVFFLNFIAGILMFAYKPESEVNF